MIQPTDPFDLRTLIRSDTYLICWAISEISRLSHTAPERHSLRYSVHAGTLQSASSIFCVLIQTVGQFVTLLRALRPDVGGWVTLSPRYWTGVPSDGGWAPYSAVLDKDLSWSSKLACCLPRQCKRICAKAETSQ